MILKSFSPANGILLVESSNIGISNIDGTMFQSRERDSISWKIYNQGFEDFVLQVSVPRTGFY